MNETLEDICLEVHEMNSFMEFYNCFNYLIGFQPLFTTIYSIFLFIGSFFLNLILIYLLLTKTEITVFDKIITIHALIDWLLCFIDYPFMILSVYFNYWPFSKWLCIVWLIVDNSLGTLEIYTLLLMSWVRLRCILAPRSYLNELIVKHIFKFIVAMWFVIFSIWTSGIIYMLLKNFYQEFCDTDFELQSINITVLFVCFLAPLSLVAMATIYTSFIMYQKKSIFNNFSKSSDHAPANVAKSEVKSKRKPKLVIQSRKYKLKLSPQIKLTIIITIFSAQYVPYYISWFTYLICEECVSTDLYNILSLLSYFPSIVNPVVMFSLNKSLFKRFK